MWTIAGKNNKYRIFLAVRSRNSIQQFSQLNSAAWICQHGCMALCLQISKSYCLIFFSRRSKKEAENHVLLAESCLYTCTYVIR